MFTFLQKLTIILITIIKQEGESKMKFLVFSDSHNSTNGMDQAIEKHKEIRHIIHCGDMADDIEYLRHVYGTTHSICSVCGNNDYFAPDPLYRVFTCDAIKIYVTHGHKEHVKHSMLQLKDVVKKNGCALGIFGHTHEQYLQSDDGITLFNPGSIGYFRQEYALLNIEKGKIEVTHRKL